MLEFLQNPTVRNILIVIGIIVVYHLFVGSKKEGFASEEKALQEADSKLVLEKRMSEEEIPIKPTYIDSDVRALISGSGFVPQHDISGPWGMEENTNKYGIVDGLDDGAGGSLGLHYNLVSPACCSVQWPLPFKTKADQFLCNNNKQKFVPSPYMGNNAWQDSGCVCMDKVQSKFLTDRGGNA